MICNGKERGRERHKRETERDRERQRDRETARETETESKRGKHHLGKLRQGKVSSFFEILSLFPEKIFYPRRRVLPAEKFVKQTLFRTICKNLYK